MQEQRGTSSKYLDFVESFNEAVLEAVKNNNTPEDIASHALKNFSYLFGGCVIYIPKLHTTNNSDRNRLIKQEFTGNNHTELARKYGLSIQAIYNILRKNK